MRILVITNRNIQNKSATDESLFGEGVNDKGPSELRLAWAEKSTGTKWKLELVGEPKSLDADNLPSLTAFKTYIAELDKSQTNCLFYVHGFNKSFPESLMQAHELMTRYGLGTVLFSWPSNPGGFILNEYRQAVSIASNSIVALDRAFEKLAAYYCHHIDESCPISLNLLLHSLGNFMFESFIRHPIFTGQTRLFDNIVLNAPDVNSEKHEDWADQLKFAVRIYATINERDNVLRASDIINSDRLGNTATNLKSTRLQYLDFTDGEGVAKKHTHFEATAAANKAVEAFFNEAFNGNKALPSDGFEFNPGKNCYDLVT